ncbi:MAG: marine proteobacterial sortase target protein [Usitatibacter sp.]
MDGKAGSEVDFKGAVTDFVELVAKALLSGIGVGVAMGLAILLLSTAAQAASANDARTGTLLFHTSQGNTPAPKVSTEVAVEVTGMIARTRVTQVFHNPGAEYVEGLYVFPLPEKAAVDHLWMKIGERVIEGQIKEKAEARRVYEQARSEGRKAAIVEQQRPNLFANSVAHIGPDERIEIRIEYQQSLAYENAEYRLRFPLAVTPRYDPLPGPLHPTLGFPGARGEREAIPDEPKAAEARGLQPVMHPEYEAPGRGGANPVDIVVTIDAGVAIGQVVSSYHDATIEKAAGHRVTVMLFREQEDADRDFELTWKVAPAAAPQAALFTQRNDATDYALLMVVPPQPTAAEMAAFQRMPREMVLIVDTSGSMQGPSIIQARQALEHALGTLTDRDRFNVVEFNSIMRPMWPATLAATAQNLEYARKWVRALQAGGGTEMAPALTFALDGRETPGMLRQVVFITDGAVGNEEALFKLISERLGGSRLFTVGIGSAPNSHFMTRAAQFGRGTFTHIGDVREVNEKMSRLFAKIEAPVLRDVTIRWPDGTPVETFPSRVPDLYLGEPVMVAASARAPLGTVVVSGTRGNQPWSVALTPSADAKSGGVGALWARSKIASLMDEVTRGADAETIRPQVVKVALEHHLVSAYTSLVAVDVAPSAPAVNPKAVMVKASLPQGYVDGTQLPQTDTPAMLQLLLGLLALSAAAVFAVAGRGCGAAS